MLPDVSTAPMSEDIIEVVAPVQPIGQVGPVGDEVVTSDVLAPVSEAIFGRKL